MRIETRERQVTTHYDIYIAMDGTEFRTKPECERYEMMHDPVRRQVIETAIETRSFDEEYPATLYNIQNEEDWDFLVKYVWYSYQDINDYPGPGVYLVIKYDGGDYHDTYNVYNAEAYINEIVKEANLYKSTISAAIKNLTSA